ncbi:MAG: hypothetical protein ACXW1O_08680 [Halobacteriota archaeon]
MTHSTNTLNAASGLAALSICESLLLALGELRIIDEKVAIDVITDAASAHRNAGETQQHVALHQEAAAILDRIIAGGNSVRHPSPKL